MVARCAALPPVCCCAACEARDTDTARAACTRCDACPLDAACASSSAFAWRRAPSSALQLCSSLAAASRCACMCCSCASRSSRRERSCSASRALSATDAIASPVPKRLEVRAPIVEDWSPVSVPSPLSRARASALPTSAVTSASSHCSRLCSIECTASRRRIAAFTSVSRSTAAACFHDAFSCSHRFASFAAHSSCAWRTAVCVCVCGGGYVACVCAHAHLPSP
mmetsp:Transcript_17005/g.38900  ORF Transcript_17005/g.38900 Transcript_17005/m.38900 type:complete len:224 (-) Transcript_17005:98-769(-)